MRLFEVQGPMIGIGSFQSLIWRFYIGTDTKSRPLVISFDISDES